MKTIKLCIWIWDMGLGGVQKRVRDIVKSLNKDYPNVKVYLLINYAQPNYFGNEFQPNDRLEIKYFYPRSFKTHRLPSSTLWMLFQYLRIKPDIVLTFLDRLSITILIIRIIAFWHKCKIVLNEGIVTSRYLQQKHKKTASLVRWLYPKADKIIAPTNAVRHDLIQHFNVPADSVEIIPNWTCLPPALPYDSPTYDVVYLGRYEAEKNIMALIDLFRHMHSQNPEFKAALVGEGSMAVEIKQAVKKFQLSESVIVKPFIRQILPILRNTKVYVLATSNEGMPNTVLEAGMCSIPVVSTNFLGAHEIIVDGKTGYIARTSSDLIQKTAYLLAHPAVCRQMGNKAQQHIQKHYSLKTQVRFIQALID